MRWNTNVLRTNARGINGDLTFFGGNNGMIVQRYNGMPV